MKFRSLLTACLVAAQGISALIVDRPTQSGDVEPSSLHALPARGGEQIGITMSRVQVWTSTKGTNRCQFRLLGPIHIVPGLAVLWHDSGVELAKAFYTDFLQQKASVLGNLENSFALYKDAAYDAVIGYQFEFETSDLFGRTQGVVIKALQQYFADANRVGVDVEYVSDAFNIGGPFMQAAKRNVNGSLKARGDTCTGYDLISALGPVNWDPDSTLYAVPMCATIPQGPIRA